MSKKNKSVIAPPSKLRKGSELFSGSLIPFENSSINFSWIWAAGISLFFFALLYMGILHHEPWRDEFQAWQIVQSANSIPGIFHNLRYEGHPIAWYLLLYPISRFSQDYFYMQLLHILLATLTAFLILRYATFPFWMRVLVIFGYYTFYEYAIISRSYVLGELGIVLFCIGWGRWKQKVLSSPPVYVTDYILPVFALLLLTSTSVFNFVEAGAFCLYAIWWCYSERKNVLPKINYTVSAFFGLLVFTVAVLTYLQMKPLPDNSFPIKYPSGIDTGRWIYSMAYILMAYLPLTNFNFLYNWNNFIIIILPGFKIFLFTLILLGFSLLSFQNKNRVLIFYIACTLAIFALNYYIQVPGARYNGQLWLVFIASLWFYYEPKESGDKPWRLSLQRLSLGAGKIFLPILLITHLAMGIYFYREDLLNKFSVITDAGKYLKQQSLNHLPLMGMPSYVVTPLSYFTGKPVFTFGRRNLSTYMIWDKQGDEIGLKFSAVMNIVDSLATHAHLDSMLVCIPTQLHGKDGITPFTESDVTPHLHLKYLAGFDSPAMVHEETFYFYLATLLKPEENTESQ